MTRLVSRVLYRFRGCRHLSCLYVTVKLCATHMILSGNITAIRKDRYTHYRVLLRIGFTGSSCYHKDR